MHSNKITTLFALLTLALLFALGTACNEEDTDGDADADADVDADADADGDGDGDGDVAGTCCLDGAFYLCRTANAFDLCAGFDIDLCMEGCDWDDFDCMDGCFDQWDRATHDPSQCERDPGRDGDCEGDPIDPIDPVEPTCAAGAACDYDSDCSSGNCTGGYCYATSVGCPCDYDSDCASGNCSSGTCYGNGAGSACDYDSDCSTGNCYQGTCYGTSAGNPCDYDSDCASGNCAGNQCQ